MSISRQYPPKLKDTVAELVKALAIGGIHPPEKELGVWKELLLTWLVEGESSLSLPASAALKAFVDKAEHQELAKNWLSQVLVAMSFRPELSSTTPEAIEPSVIPSYMRYVADEILGRPPPTDPPAYPDILHAASLEPLMLDWEEDHSEETAVSRGLQILCDFAAESDSLCDWLMKTDILTPCQILAKKELQLIKEQQQIARLLALLSACSFHAENFVEWLPWLQIKVESSDSLLASNALRALIHIRQKQTGRQNPLFFHDGIHFFNAHNHLCDSLVLKGNIADGTVADVVFVHGIRGGPYITWRSEGTSDTHSTRESCWPSHWLAEDLPHARLISVEFAAPVTSWEGGSGPVKQTAWKIAEKLRDAGVGSRPLVFVAHSMGGIIVKEILAHETERLATSSLTGNTQGIVFISTPHHGVWLAHLAWGLRHIGACPAPCLNTMKPGPYLEDLNSKIQQWAKRRQIPILSFAEMQTTKVLSVLPKLQVVPPSSAFPGYGQFIPLEDLDHITSCKPKHRTDAFYQYTLKFLKDIMDQM